ncbi:uncharacterized protein LOC143299248 [Babylonia areolata]|uniref:uncharacterized protein LOC143299248 n=1 Tax=Babylonia areolata TaxID=304850 RepID=UPI003FD5E8DF
MASPPTTKLIVKNLPERWTPDHLVNYLEVTSGERLMVARDGVQVFPGVTHSALLTLEEAVTEEMVQEAERLLARALFQKTNILTLRILPSRTCSLLVYYSDPGVSRDHIFYYFDEPQQSGCGEGYVEDCQIYQELMLAVVRFSSAEALEGVMVRGNHRLQKEGEVLKVEPWYDLFHTPLLQQLTAHRRPHQSQAACQQSTHHSETSEQGGPLDPDDQRTPARPTVSDHKPTVPSASNFHGTGTHGSAATRNTTDTLEADEVEKLRLENEQLKQMLASKEAREHKRKEELRLQMLHRIEEQTEKERKAEALRVQREHLQRAQSELQMENVQLKNENEKLKKPVTTYLPVPSYKYRLLETFAEQCTACQMTFLEQKEQLMFHGTEEDCETEKLHVLKQLHNLADDAISLTEPMARILDSPSGRSYLADLVQRHWGCAAEIVNCQVLCAALSVEEVEDFKRKLQRNILKETCQVPLTLIKSVQFQGLKIRLEKEYMVILTHPGDDSEDIELDGLRGDIQLAVRDLNHFTNLNRSGSKKFVITGALQGNACRNWFAAELDDVKQLILRNNGEIEGETKDGEYVLQFQCHQDVQDEVITRLESISSCIVSQTIDLNNEFPEYSERALLVNGLYDMGARHFCWTLADKLMSSGVPSVGDITLPERPPLPSFSLAREKGSHRKSHPSSQDQSQKQHHHHRKSKARRPRGRRGGSLYSGMFSMLAGSLYLPKVSDSVSVGRTTVTVKLGDITAEQVEAAVSVLGTDLNPKATALGSVFLSKWPFLSMALTFSGGGEGGGEGSQCRLVTTTATGSPLPMSVLYHAVLSRLHRRAVVSKTVKELVLQILHSAAEKGLKSIAFPTLGVGKRFGFGGYTTASAMMSAFQEFLQTNPRSIENISVVVYKDVDLAGKFVKVMKQTFRRKRAAASATAMATSDSDSSEISDSDMSEDEEESGQEKGEEEEEEERFEVVVCTQGQGDCQAVRTTLLEELRTSLLWQETLSHRQTQALLRLPPHTLQSLTDVAVERHLLLGDSGNGKDVRLCGRRDRVQEMLVLILERIGTDGVGRSQADIDKRRKLRLPEDTDRIPSYWRVCQEKPNVTYNEAIESWKRRGLRFNSVGEEELKAVKRLVSATWDASKVGKGADAKNLHHSSIQVRRVERLENPKLWQRYSQKRERLFTALVDGHRGSGPARCAPVERLPSSSGPVHTTRKIPEHSLLQRDMFHQVNEHYLFHGTKTEILSKICGEGLDDRMTGNAMLGRGVYLTESPTKADQYADPKGARVPAGQELKILLVRVLLGEPYLHAGKPESFVRPPCYVCKKRAHNCHCKEARCHDSVLFDSNKIFREFVVYDRDVCYPEYIITYVRK